MCAYLKICMLVGCAYVCGCLCVFMYVHGVLAIGIVACMFCHEFDYICVRVCVQMCVDLCMLMDNDYRIANTCEFACKWFCISNDASH